MPKQHHLNKKEYIGSGVLVKYHKDRPPNAATKKALIAATQLSARIMRAAVWKMDRVVFFRRDESYLTAIVNKHFRLGQPGETTGERRRYLNKVRQVMLSTSFHLNTGVYLLDIDGGHRRVGSGAPLSAQDLADMPLVEGYVTTTRGRFIETAGPIHLGFDLCQQYTARGIARVIIHEATHSFWKTVDVAYSHDPDYDIMTPDEAVTNADSFAYAALSIEAKAVQTHASLDLNGDH